MSEYQGYDAILVRGTPRFRKDKKMVATNAVPLDIRNLLVTELMAPVPEPSVAAPVMEPGVVPITVDTPQLEGADFNVDETISVGVAGPHTIADIDPPYEVSPGMPTQYEIELIKELEQAKMQLASTKQAQPAELSLEQLAKQLRDRFGIYTVFAGSEPKPGDAHPFTGKPMTRYEMGIAYSAYTAALGQGRLVVDYELQHKVMEDSNAAVEMHSNEIERRKVEPDFDVPKHMSFQERTSVEGQKYRSTTTVSRPNDPISEDVTAEPNLRGTTIRPDW